MDLLGNRSGSRRDAIRLASGLGVATMVLPAAAQAASYADSQFAAIDPAWTLSDLLVRAESDDTYCFVALSTTEEVTFVIRWYRVVDDTYNLLASSASVTPPFGEEVPESGPFLFDSGLIVPGVPFTAGTYAARVFLNGSTTTYVAQISGSFPPA